ncbi:MAG: hypothetical protein HY735_16585 [Verrucomicrobia bacterium]|nr:hypothetical protein [Verrucomicrobiota bacterium]
MNPPISRLKFVVCAVTVCAILGTEYQISADGKHHVIKGRLLVAYALGRYRVNEGQTFVPPADPKAPGAMPTVRPTRPDELPVMIVDGDGELFVPPPPPLEPIQFISPGTGTPPGAP